jgi:hypothetical protein
LPKYYNRIARIPKNYLKKDIKMSTSDLILLLRNLLEDIATVRELLGLMAAGSWYPTEQLSELLDIPGSIK